MNPKRARRFPGAVIPRISVRCPFDASLIVAESKRARYTAASLEERAESLFYVRMHAHALARYYTGSPGRGGKASANRHANFTAEARN